MGRERGELLQPVPRDRPRLELLLETELPRQTGQLEEQHPRLGALQPRQAREQLALELAGLLPARPEQQVQQGVARQGVGAAGQQQLAGDEEQPVESLQLLAQLGPGETPEIEVEEALPLGPEQPSMTFGLPRPKQLGLEYFGRGPRQPPQEAEPGELLVGPGHHRRINAPRQGREDRGAEEGHAAGDAHELGEVEVDAAGDVADELVAGRHAQPERPEGLLEPPAAEAGDDRPGQGRGHPGEGLADVDVGPDHRPGSRRRRTPAEAGGQAGRRGRGPRGGQAGDGPGLEQGDPACDLGPLQVDGPPQGLLDGPAEGREPLELLLGEAGLPDLGGGQGADPRAALRMLLDQGLLDGHAALQQPALAAEQEGVRRAPADDRLAQPPGRGDQHLLGIAGDRVAGEQDPGHPGRDHLLDHHGHGRGLVQHQAIGRAVGAVAVEEVRLGPERGPAASHRVEQGGEAGHVEVGRGLPGVGGLQGVLARGRAADRQPRQPTPVLQGGVGRDQRIPEGSRDARGEQGLGDRGGLLHPGAGPGEERLHHPPVRGGGQTEGPGHGEARPGQPQQVEALATEQLDRADKAGRRMAQVHQQGQLPAVLAFDVTHVLPLHPRRRHRRPAPAASCSRCTGRRCSWPASPAERSDSRADWSARLRAAAAHAGDAPGCARGGSRSGAGRRARAGRCPTGGGGPPAPAAG